MIHYEIHFNSEEDLSAKALLERIQSAFPGANVLHSCSSYFAELPEDFTPNLVPFPDGHADQGCEQPVAESEPAAPAVPDTPVVADDTPTDIPGPSAPVSNVSKEELKKVLFDLRDAKGADAVKALYEECGQGAKTLKTLDESCYIEMYNRAVKLLAD